MGIVLSNFKKAFLEEIKNSITSNTSQYYAFAANPIENTANSVANNTADDYSSMFEYNWKMLFGKKLSNSSIVPLIQNITWTSNTVYDRYDNTEDLSSSNFYVVTTPSEVGGYYNVFKCINNADGDPSTSKPDLIEESSFTKADGYTWRYMYSISTTNYNRFATSENIPVYANANMQDSAYDYSGVEVVVISNSGSGYASYHDGIVRSVSNSTLIQINNDASGDNHFYTDSAIYIYNEVSTTSQLKNITSYISNGSGKWVYLDTPANTTNIIPSTTQYKISPRVLFDTDGESEPAAYSTVNSTSNSILSVVILDTGYGITRANVSIVSNSGSGANLYCIVPPPGGHSSNPENELLMNGLGVYFEFNGYESNNITINTLYNKIGIIKNPYSLTANNTKGTAYSNTTFNQVLEANVGTSVTFDAGDTVIGNTTGAVGVVVFSNTTVIHLVGDQGFESGEYITSSNGSVSTTMTINTLGDIYTKDIIPLYVRNISDVTRANAQSEAFNLIIQV